MLKRDALAVPITELRSIYAICSANLSPFPATVNIYPIKPSKAKDWIPCPISLYKGWDYIACTTAWHFIALHSFIHSTASIPRFTVQLQHARLFANRPWRLVSLWMALWFERVMFLDTPPFPTNGCSSKLGSPELVVSPARHDRFWMILDDFGIIPQLKKTSQWGVV